jgi:hypothetical protein
MKGVHVSAEEVRWTDHLGDAERRAGIASDAR